MFTWILENIATLIIGVILLAIIAGIIVGIVRDQKKGKSSCGCGCANCPMGGSCHQKK